MYRKLLTLYGEVEFEGYLKSGLMVVDEPSLLQPSLEAFLRSLASGHVYLASQLLPPIMRWSEETFWLLVRELRGHSSEPDYEFNVVEALAYVWGERARAELSRLATKASPAVSAEAQRALQVLPGAAFAGDMPLTSYRAYQISQGGRTTYAIDYDGAEIARIPSVVVSKGHVIVEYEPADGRLRHEFAGELVKRVLLHDLLEGNLGAQAHELPLLLTRRPRERWARRRAGVRERRLSTHPFTAPGGESRGLRKSPRGKQKKALRGLAALPHRPSPKLRAAKLNRWWLAHSRRVAGEPTSLQSANQDEHGAARR